MVAMIRALAVELARHGIRANAILPGWIETAMTAGSVANDRFRATVLPRIRVGRWGGGADFGGIAVHLAGMPPPGRRNSAAPPAFEWRIAARCPVRRSPTGRHRNNHGSNKSNAGVTDRASAGRISALPVSFLTSSAPEKEDIMRMNAIRLAVLGTGLLAVPALAQGVPGNSPLNGGDRIAAQADAMTQTRSVDGLLQQAEQAARQGNLPMANELLERAESLALTRSTIAGTESTPVRAGPVQRMAEARAAIARRDASTAAMLIAEAASLSRAQGL